MKTFLSFLLLSSTLFANDLDMDRVSETLGHMLIRQLKEPGIALNMDKMIQGMHDEEKGLPSPMTEEEYEQAMATLQESLFLKLAERNLSEAETFLEQNSHKEGVIAVDPKLQYRIAQTAEGAIVGEDSSPQIHFTGKLLDGTVFATSPDDPVTLPIKQSIPGFAKGLVGMHAGEKRVLYIHPDLAYGLGGNLPPNSLLIFEVEIVQAE